MSDFKENYGFFQDQIVWYAIMAYILLFVIKSDWGKENLESWQLAAKQTDTSLILVLALLTGKKGFDILRTKIGKKIDEHNPIGGE